MTPQQIVAMAVRLFSIWMLMIALQSLGIVTMMRNEFRPDSGALMLIFPLLISAAAILLWMFPLFVAHRLVPATHHSNIVKLPARAATAAGAAILGLWAVVGSLPDLIAQFALVIMTHGTPYGESFSPHTNVKNITTLAQLVIGIILLFKAWPVAAMVFPENRDRPADVDSAPPLP